MDKFSKQLVSVCIPVYNGELYLEQALESVKSQTYKNIEIIISDDDSWDSSLKIIKEFKKNVNFPIHVFSHEPKGIGSNWNYCVSKANGEYIKFLFQDDILEPNCINEMVAKIDSHEDVGLVACKRDFIFNKKIDSLMEEWLNKYSDLQSKFDSSNNLLVLDKYNVFSRLDFFDNPKNMIGEPSTVLFRRSILENVGWFREDFKQSLDYEFYYRVLNFYKIIIIPEKLVKFRLHQNQTTEINKKNEIVDYKIYPKLIYKNYKSLLHPIVRKKLWRKYSTFGKFLNKLGI